jgi:hypothetical protein
MQRLFRSGPLPLRYPGYGEGRRPGRPNCGRNQRRQTGAGHIQDDIPEAGSPGGEKPLAPLVQRGEAQTTPQRPEAGAPRPIVRMPPKSPEPKEIHEAVRHDMPGFPQIEINHIKLGRFKDYKPGQQPLEQMPGVSGRSHISRHAQHCQTPKDGGKPISNEGGPLPK